MIHLSRIEYSKFKPFVLSVLWRAGVSSLDVFDQVKLGLHEEILREMILNDEPGTEGIYPFVLWPFLHQNTVQEAFIVKPIWMRLGDHNAYRGYRVGICR